MGEVLSVAEIEQALMGRWTPDQFVHIPECPTTPDRSGRRLDVLIVDCWRSRGLARIGVEIKRTVADFTKELKDPDKADWWVERTNEFWIAAPSKIAQRINANGRLPHAWGLLAVSDGGRCTALVAAPRRSEPEPLSWGAVVGAFRTVSGAGANALQREWDKGHAAARADLGDLEESRTAKRDLERLRSKVASFEQASGITVGVSGWTGPDIALALELARTIRVVGSNVDGVIRTLQRDLERLAQSATALREASST